MMLREMRVLTLLWGFHETHGLPLHLIVNLKIVWAW